MDILPVRFKRALLLVCPKKKKKMTLAMARHLHPRHKLIISFFLCGKEYMKITR